MILTDDQPLTVVKHWSISSNVYVGLLYTLYTCVNLHILMIYTQVETSMDTYRSRQLTPENDSRSAIYNLLLYDLGAAQRLAMD